MSMSSPPSFPPSAPPKRGLSGCAIAAIIGVGAGVVMIPILGILAAIAIPQYQEYVVRTKVLEGIHGVRAILPSIDQHKGQTGTCPDNAAIGVGDGRDGRFGKYVSAVAIGTSAEGAEGACQVELRFDALGPANDATSTLIYRQTTDAWDCTGGTLPERYRPNECRTTPR
jgi:type IV pilus assembly protein PilA